MMPPIALLALLTGALVQAPADTVLADRAVREAAFYTGRDGGALWSLSLNTPLLIVDPGTRQAVSNVPDSAGLMTRAGDFHTAQLPAALPLANTAVTWGGRTWAMVLSPLPADSIERGILLVHETWHAVQGRAGIPLATPDNPHLETASGCIWLRVEGRALAAALASSGRAQRTAMSDAFAARLMRRAAFPGSDSSERALELTEGLAEFTGIAVVAAPDERARIGHDRLARLERNGSLMRSFPYATGTAWALLLDMTDPGWRAYLTPDTDLALMAAEAMSLDTARIDRGDARFAAYALGEIRSEEMAREVARAARQDSLRARYVTGPTLLLPLAEMNMSFDPNSAEALQDVGTVYRPMRLSDRWGVLEADSSGALVETGFQAAKVARPAPGGLSGPGWKLTLNAGWKVVPGERKGDYTLRKR